jgi:hypothetical protein
MPRPLDIISHWHHSAQKLSLSTLEYYNSLESALRAKDIVGLSLERVEWHEAGLLTATRTYLRLSYRRFVFDVSAFPFGTDFYFSWWLGKRVPNIALLGCGALAAVIVALPICIAIAGFVGGLLLFLALLGAGLFALGSGTLGLAEDVQEAISELPLVGPMYRKLFNPATYYSKDTRIMFEETVHRVVLDVVGGVLTINKMTPLTEAEKAVQHDDER